MQASARPAYAPELANEPLHEAAWGALVGLIAYLVLCRVCAFCCAMAIAALR